MIKKVFAFIGVLFSFFLLFLFGFDKINVLAYSDIGNALGSYPVKLDVDNYQRYNLFDNLSYKVDEYQANIVDKNVSTINIKCNFVDCYVGDVFNISSQYYINVKPSTTYKFSYNDNNVGSNSYIGFFDSNNNYLTLKQVGSNDSFLTPDNCYKIVVRLGVQNGTIGQIYDFTHIQITEGQEQLPFAPFFKFGYNVNYSLAVNNLTSSQIDAGIAIIDSNGNYLKTGNCVIPASSSIICNNINDPLYVPFSIDNNGFVSFDYSLGLFIGPVSNLSVTSNDSGLNFVPVFTAYYKNSWTNNLYFKDRYTFNNLFLSGFNVSVNSSALSKTIFPRNEIDSEFFINTNKIVNFATDKKIETGIYNYIDYSNFINSTPNDIYSFAITTGVSDPSLFANRIYTISFSNLSLKVNGDSSNTSPLPNNSNTINKYNSCSAWYDIPCQLGNGLTYVIYEAPIISPVLTFIVSFITMFSSLVSFVELFRSFGLVFGCFVIYMFIELLHKYSK